MKFSDITLPTITNTAGKLMLDLLRSLVQAGQQLEAAVPSVEKFIYTEVEFSEAALTKTITLFTAAKREAVDEVVIELNESFVGTGITALTAKIGISGDTEKYIAAFDLLQAVSATSNDEGKFNLGRYDIAEGTDVELLIEATGANLDQLSAGGVDVWVTRSNLA